MQNTFSKIFFLNTFRKLLLLTDNTFQYPAGIAYNVHNLCLIFVI